MKHPQTGEEFQITGRQGDRWVLVARSGAEFLLTEKELARWRREPAPSEPPQQHSEGCPFHGGRPCTCGYYDAPNVRIPTRSVMVDVPAAGPHYVIGPCDVPGCTAAHDEKEAIGPMAEKETKPPWDLVPVRAMREVVKVFGFGAKKHAPNGWQHVEDGRRIYYAATMRHLTDWWAGERIDSQSGLPTLAHAACSALILLAIELQSAD